jgi:hypothetical protein
MYCRPERSGHRWRMVLAGVVSMCVWASAGDFVPGGPCTRGRIRMNDKTLVTDWGTLLHGACWALDMIKNVPPREDLVAIKQCGVNLLHVYFERYDAPYCKGIGYNVDKMDTLVEWCRQESLYIIMTIGGTIVGYWNPKYQTDIDSTKKIWEFYAPRYADQTHVIYEIKNEPEGTQIRLEKACYPIIHSAAPETHVLIGSQSSVAGGPCRVLCPIDSMQDLMDWSNTSIAFHGYSVTGDFQLGVIEAANEAGHAMTMTECWANRGLEEYYERAQISYAPMCGCFTPLASQKCDCQHKLNPSYVPDFGSWPQAHVDYPTTAEWEPWSCRAQKRTMQMYGLTTTGAVPGRKVGAAYDLSGRLLWRRGAGSKAAGGQTDEIPKGLGSRPLVLKYDQ